MTMRGQRIVTAPLYLTTGIFSACSALYLWGASASGFPIQWWSGSLVILLLAASVGMVLAAPIGFVSIRIARIIALGSASILELYFVAIFGRAMSSILSHLTSLPFVFLVFMPMLLSTGVLVVSAKDPIISHA